MPVNLHHQLEIFKISLEEVLRIAGVQDVPKLDALYDSPPISENSLSKIWDDNRRKILYAAASRLAGYEIKPPPPPQPKPDPLDAITAFLRTKGGWGRNKGAAEILAWPCEDEGDKWLKKEVARYITNHEKTVVSTEQIIKYIKKYLY